MPEAAWRELRFSADKHKLGGAVNDGLAARFRLHDHPNRPVFQARQGRQPRRAGIGGGVVRFWRSGFQPRLRGLARRRRV